MTAEELCAVEQACIGSLDWADLVCFELRASLIPWGCPGKRVKHDHTLLVSNTESDPGRAEHYRNEARKSRQSASIRFVVFLPSMPRLWRKEASMLRSELRSAY
jgi:hypothetical protein